MAHRKLPWPVGWMKKHERSIVIFGALGLVGTFILKEMVADSLKDFKDSVSEAESSFRARSEFMDLRKQIAIVEQRVRNMADVQDRVINKTKPAKEMPQASEQSGAHRVPYFELDYTGMRMPVDDKIANVEELLEYVKLPEEDAKRLQDDKAFLEKMLTDARALDQGNPSAKETEDKVLQMNVGVMLVDDHLGQLAPRLLRLARDEERSRERQYGWCKRLNLFFFIAGVALAVVAKLYDFKAFGGPE
jgi:hypothetical protein